MRDHLEQLVLGHAVVECALEVADLLLGAVERDQGGACNQAAVALGKALALPDVAEQHVVRQVDQLGGELPQRLPRGGRIGRWFGHGCSFSGWMSHGLAWPMKRSGGRS